MGMTPMSPIESALDNDPNLTKAGVPVENNPLILYKNQLLLAAVAFIAFKILF